MNIQYIRNCYGCGLCAIACPKRIINIELNKKGLLSPFFIEVTYERTLYSHTVLQTKMQVL